MGNDRVGGDRPTTRCEDAWTHPLRTSGRCWSCSATTRPWTAPDGAAGLACPRTPGWPSWPPPWPWSTSSPPSARAASPPSSGSRPAGGRDRHGHPQGHQRGGAGGVGQGDQPKELTAIQDEVAALKRRQVALEDDLLERMEQRETLEAELADLDGRRETITTEQEEVTRRATPPWSRSTPTLATEQAAADEVAPGSGRSCGLSTTRSAGARGRGAAALVGNTRAAGCRSPWSSWPPSTSCWPPPTANGARTAAASWWSRPPTRWWSGPTAGRAATPAPPATGWWSPRPAARSSPAGRGDRLGDQQRGRVPGRDRRPGAGPGPWARRVRVRADLLLVVNQQKGQWKVKNAALQALVGRDTPAGRPVRAGHLGARAAPAQPARRRSANQAMDAQGRSSARSGTCREPDLSRQPFATPIWRI